MKGLLFNDLCYNRANTLDHRQSWCVQINGKRCHLICHTKGTAEKPEHDIKVGYCDETCGKYAAVPADIWKEALRQIGLLP
ncbi:MAG: hypothetical protein WC845_02820 [Candidatus Staskawiczbacteria bacterium]